MVSDSEWRKVRLKELIDVSKELSQINKGVYYPIKEWSPLKLIALMLYVNGYTKIMGRQKEKGNIDKMFFIDFLADSGINLIEEKRVYIAGSPLIAIKFAYSPFDKSFLIEKDVDRATALANRMKAVKADFEVFNGDCNEKIDGVLAQMPSYKSHYLAFIDCEGYEVKWDTMEKLLKYRGDIIFNFQTQQINRTLGKIKCGQADRNIFDEFFGDKRWDSLNDGEELLEHYMDKLKSRGRGRIERIKIICDTPYHFQYDLIFATRKTSGDNPWWKIVEDLKTKIERNAAQWVGRSIDILTGRSNDLEQFLPGKKSPLKPLSCFRKDS